MVGPQPSRQVKQLLEVGLRVALLPAHHALVDQPEHDAADVFAAPQAQFAQNRRGVVSAAAQEVLTKLARRHVSLLTCFATSDKAPRMNSTLPNGQPIS
jgi:hypothetical protein